MQLISTVGRLWGGRADDALEFNASDRTSTVDLRVEGGGIRCSR